MQEKSDRWKRAGMFLMGMALFIDAYEGLSGVVGILNNVAIVLALVAFGIFAYGKFLEPKEEK